MTAEEADAVLLVLGLAEAEGGAENAILENIEGGELSRGYAGLITLTGHRLARVLQTSLSAILPVVRSAAAARPDFTPAELQAMTPAMDLMRSVWAGDKGAVEYWMNPVRHEETMFSLAALTGWMLHYEADRTGLPVEAVISDYRDSALQVLAR